MIQETLARYRLVLVPLLLVYGAAAIVCLWDLARERRLGRLAVGLALISVVAGAQHLRHSRGFELTFVPSFNLEDPAKAKDLFTLILGLNPQDPSGGDLRRLIARLGP